MVFQFQVHAEERVLPRHEFGMKAREYWPPGQALKVTFVG